MFVCMSTPHAWKEGYPLLLCSKSNITHVGSRIRVYKCMYEFCTYAGACLCMCVRVCVFFPTGCSDAGEVAGASC